MARDFAAGTNLNFGDAAPIDITGPITVHAWVNLDSVVD